MIKQTFLALWLLVLVGTMNNSCTFTNDKSNKSEKSGPEFTSAYICPMYCDGSGSNEPGTCPVCKMVYVPNENIQ